MPRVQANCLLDAKSVGGAIGYYAYHREGTEAMARCGSEAVENHENW
jgi:hypothetical protein